MIWIFNYSIIESDKRVPEYKPACKRTKFDLYKEADDQLNNIHICNVQEQRVIPPLKTIDHSYPYPTLTSVFHRIKFQISTNDALIAPWRIDPCQLETHRMVEDPVRLLSGRLKITWNHYGNVPAYKLIVTVLGKGYHCNQKGKHPCLRFG